MKILKMILVIISILLVIIAGIMLWGVLQSRDLVVKDINIKSDKLPDEFDGYKIALISDLHGRQMDNLAYEIIDQDADILIIAGDLIDAHDTSYDAAFNLCQQLTEEMPLIWVKGNHFYKSDESLVEQMDIDIRELGIIVLENEIHIIEKDGSSIVFAGLDDPQRLLGVTDIVMEYRKAAEKSIISRNLDSIDIDSDNYNILISHRPTNADMFAEAGYNLTMCGHTHGGQVCLPFGYEIIGDNAQFFPKIISGYNEVDGMPLIITSGLGYSFLKIRTFNPPEILVITLEQS